MPPFRWPGCILKAWPEKELAKLFYIANTFIFEETGKKNREKWQFGAELIGMGSPLADVELIALAVEVLKKLGLEKVEIKLIACRADPRDFAKTGLEYRGAEPGLRPAAGRRCLCLSPDQGRKTGTGASAGVAGQVLRLCQKPGASALDLPELKPQIDDFVFIADALQSLGYDYQIDIASVRGFEYYTGVIFQLFVNDEKVGGGGRYDALIPAMGGRHTPASGFALYLDR